MREISLFVFMLCRISVNIAQDSQSKNIRYICPEDSEVTISCNVGQTVYIEREYYGIRENNPSGGCRVRSNDCNYDLPKESHRLMTGDKCNGRPSCTFFDSEIKTWLEVAIQKMKRKDNNCLNLENIYTSIEVEYRCIEDHLRKDICEKFLIGTPKSIYLMARQEESVCSCTARGQNLKIKALEVRILTNATLQLHGNQRACDIEKNENYLYNREINCGSSSNVAVVIADLRNSPSSIVTLQISGAGSIEVTCGITNSNITKTKISTMNNNTDVTNSNNSGLDTVDFTNVGKFILIPAVLGIIIISCFTFLLVRRHKKHRKRISSTDSNSIKQDISTPGENSYTYIDCPDSDYSSMGHKNDDGIIDQNGYQQITFSDQSKNRDKDNYDHCDGQFGVYGHPGNTRINDTKIKNDNLYNHINV